TRVPLVHLPDDTYFWRVRAIAPNGTESAWSDGGGTSFDVRWVEPTWNDDENTYPDYGAVTSDLRIGWTPMAGASAYWVQAATRPGCFWDGGLAPLPYGTWVGQSLLSGAPMPPQNHHCRLTPTKLVTQNNWMTLKELLDDTVV